MNPLEVILQENSTERRFPEVGGEPSEVALMGAVKLIKEPEVSDD